MTQVVLVLNAEVLCQPRLLCLSYTHSWEKDGPFGDH